MSVSKVPEGARAVWIAVNAHPNREHTAEAHLRNQEYDAYLPLMRKQIRHARQVRTVLRPLFPGYLFVRVTSSHMRWRPILSTVTHKTDAHQEIDHGAALSNVNAELVSAGRASCAYRTF
jgi:hypothetical protein